MGSLVDVYIHACFYRELFCVSLVYVFCVEELLGVTDMVVSA